MEIFKEDLFSKACLSEAMDKMNSFKVYHVNASVSKFGFTYLTIEIRIVNIWFQFNMLDTFANMYEIVN